MTIDTIVNKHLTVCCLIPPVSVSRPASPLDILRMRRQSQPYFLCLAGDLCDQ